MTHTVSRRTVAKGLAWSVPVTAAAANLPALAASQPQQSCEYRLGYSWRTRYRYNYGPDWCRTEVTFTTDHLETVPWKGFAPTYFGDDAVDTKAHFEYVEFIITYPKGMVSPRGWNLDTDTWRVEKKDWTYVYLEDGGQADVRNYDVYVFTFQGYMNGPIREHSKTTSWPGSVFTATSPATNYCDRDQYPIYAGYRWKFTTDNGQTVEATRVRPTTLLPEG